MEFTDKIPIKEKLDWLKSFAKRVFSVVDAVKTFLTEWIQVGEQVHLLSVILKTLHSFITSSYKQSLYLRPCDRILEMVERVLNHALAMASKSHSKGIIHRLFNPINPSSIQKLSRDLNDSIFDIKWLLTIYKPMDNDCFCGINIGVLPPIVNSNSVLLLVWQCIASVQMGRRLSDRIDAVQTLALLSEDNEKYRTYILQEQGVPVLLNLLKESEDLNAQIAAADALCVLTNDPAVVKNITIVLVRLLKYAPFEIQIKAAELVALMAEEDMIAECEFPKENVIFPLITLLSGEDDPESDEINQLRIGCAKALWKLSRSNVSFCKIIARKNPMLCMAKIVEKENGPLQHFCLMILTEITAAAESDLNFRCVAFKTNSPSAKAVVEQLVRVIKESQDPELQIPAIKSIGSLARIFSAGEISVIGYLALLLHNKNLTVATEAAIALSKFIHEENFHHKRHWKSIDEFNAVPALLRLLKSGSKMKMQHTKVNLPSDIFDSGRKMKTNLVISWGTVDGIRFQFLLSNKSVHNQKDLEHHSKRISVDCTINSALRCTL